MLTKLISKPIYPSFLIAGVQKGGTTALFHYLGKHPEILAPVEKEIDYFWLDHLYEKGESWYLDHFPRQKYFLKEKRLTFEACPHYLFSPKSAPRICDFNPSMKIILLLRAPIERAFAQFQMYQRRRENKQQLEVSAAKYGGAIAAFFKTLKDTTFFQDFGEAVEQEWEALQQGNTLAPHLLSQGLYAKQLETYLNYFSREQILVINQTTFANNTIQTLEQVAAFLEIKNINWSAMTLEKENEGNYTEKIDPKTYLALQQIFAEPNKQLYALLGQDFNW